MRNWLFWSACVCLGPWPFACSGPQSEIDPQEQTEDDVATDEPSPQTGGQTGKAGSSGGLAGGWGGGTSGIDREDAGTNHLDTMAAGGATPPSPRLDAGPRSPDARPDGAMVVRQPPPGTCTQILGMSITSQWSLSTGTFERLVNGDAWQMQIRTGRGVGASADPSFDGWQQPVQSPCTRLSSAPDRVLFEVLSASGFRGETDPVVIEREIKAMLVTLRAKLPSVRVVILQPVVGGPNGEPCMRGDGAVMASAVHPAAVQAIRRVVASDTTGTLFESFAPTVRTCSDYTVENGNPGHLEPSARAAIAERMAAVLRGL